MERLFGKKAGWYSGDDIIQGDTIIHYFGQNFLHFLSRLQKNYVIYELPLAGWAKLYWGGPPFIKAFFYNLIASTH